MCAKYKVQIIPSEKVKPHYILTIDYMIGDADGDHSETFEFYQDEDYYLQNAIALIEILKKLRPTKGYWGIMLEEERLSKAVLENQITDEEKFFVLDGPFQEIIRDSCCDEREWLTLEEAYLVYVDEYGIQHDVKWQVEK